MNLARLLFPAAFCFLAPLARAADPAPLSDLLPQDTFAFAEFIPSSNSSPDTLTPSGLSLLQSLGLLRNQAGEVADFLSLAAVAGESHTCLALLDADLHAARDGSLDIKSVQLVWIIETRDPADLLERLTRIIARYSSPTTAHQSLKKTAEGKKEFVEFRDAHWPAWLTLAWAQQSVAPESPTAPGTSVSRFILALGPGAMEHYLADRPVGEVPWNPLLRSVEAARVPQIPAETLLARLFISPKLFRERFPDALHQTPLSRLFAALDLATSDDSFLTARIQDRAVSLATATFTQGTLALKSWTLPASSSLFKALPPEATAYAVLNINWPDFYERAIALSDLLLSNPAGASIEKDLNDTAVRLGIDLRQDILNRLEPLILIHNAPQHPLGLPLMFTAVAAADPGSGDKVRTSLAKLTASAAVSLDRVAGLAPPSPEPAHPPSPLSPTSDFARLRLRTDEAGISYLQFGLVGPAWGWTENRLVLSWSPAAVRANLPSATQVPSTAFTQPK